MSNSLLDSLRKEIQLRGHSTQTEKTFLFWIKQFLLFTHKQHPRQSGSKEVNRFLSWLAAERQVSPQTQNAALAALRFLYDNVLQRHLGDLDFTPARVQHSLPAALSPEETQLIINQLAGPAQLAAQLMYGCGLRASETLGLRICDIDLECCTLTLHGGSIRGKRQAVFSSQMKDSLRNAMAVASNVHATDQRRGIYPAPPAKRRQEESMLCDTWAYLFPAETLSKDSATGDLYRHHLSSAVVDEAVVCAARAAGFRQEPVDCRLFRRAFASHHLKQGTNLQTLQILLGHNDIGTTRRYTQALEEH